MVSRRDLFKMGAAAAAAASTVATVVRPTPAKAHDADAALKGGRGVSMWSGVELKPVPSVCTICPSLCPILTFLEDGRLVKVQGNPASERTMGRLCSRGLASVEQVYDPDRILWPLKRTGKRGEGKWERISWDAALQELGGRLKTLKEAGTPERFMLLHGRMSAGTERLVKDVFLAAYGSATVSGPESLGRAARRVAHQLTWGGAEDNWDLAKAHYVVNFGSNFLEAHTNHVALARRFASASADRGLKMVTFDVRLSNTAARGSEWVPIRPGTDLAVVLAMCHVIMAQGLYNGEFGQGERFLAFCRVGASPAQSVQEKVEALKAHLAGYTPEWAEGISGVPAAKIRDVAVTFARERPACVISHRGASSHWNGVETERAIQMLAAITGNIDNPGGRCRAVRGEWVMPGAPKGSPEPRRLEILDGPEGAAALPLYGMGHHALRRIKDGKAGRPEVLVWYAHNPVYSNGAPAETAAILKDDALLPFTVAVTPFYDESSALADLILPDTTFLESWDLEVVQSADQVPEHLIRQPAIPPQGEARDFKDVVGQIAELVGLKIGIDTGEKLVREATRLTEEIRRKAGGFNGMRKTGLYRPKDATPSYNGYATKVPGEALEKAGVILDEATGVYWNWKMVGVASEEAARAKGYAATPGAARGYVAQRVGEHAVVGFPPDKVAKTGLFELYSQVLADKGMAGLPTWQPIPAHRELPPDRLVLTTFKVNVQSQGRTQNSRLLQEIRYDNPAWLHPKTAMNAGIKSGDRVRIKSEAGEFVATARVTEAVRPDVVAMSTHFGHREYGRLASDRRSPTGVEDPRFRKAKWWKRGGAHQNEAIAVNADPVAGQQAWMDTVVTIAKV